MSDTPARLLRLLSLLQTPRQWPGGELAERLGVSLRTVRRDVDRLRDLGYPIEAAMGALGGYRLVAGTALPPLLLDDEEAVAIAVGLRTAAGQAVADIEEASVRALGKLEQVLPARLRRRVGTLGAATVPTPPSDGARVDPAHLTVFAAAVANRERVRMHYTAADGTEAPRHVEPHRLVTVGRRWYLVAYDLDRDDWRIFRADRVAEPRATGARVAPRDLPAADAAAYVTERSYSLLPVHRALATVHAPADTVTARIGSAVGDVEPVDDRTCRLHLHADTLEYLAFRLVQLGCDFVVHEPPQLREYVFALGARLTRAGGRPPSPP